MLISKICPKGKKALLNSILSYFYSFFKTSKPLIVLEAYASFHLEHFETIIMQLSEGNEAYVAVISPNYKSIGKFKNICFYQTIEKFPLYKKADIFISTELNNSPPFWFDCPLVYFGHGMGPKLNYVNNQGLFEYDYVFSPCMPTYEVQTKILNKEVVFPIGMPILDNGTSKKEKIIKALNLDRLKPILVYAPSWCSDISKISDIKTIVSFLKTKSQFNVIISPHPLLFQPERCSGEVIFTSQKTIEGIIINSPNSSFNTLELVKASSIVISDISSILFEAMALKKKVLIDGNRELYEYSEAMHIFDKLVKVCNIPDWSDINDQTIEDIQVFDDLFSHREKFINSYLFNRGIASETFIDTVNVILSMKNAGHP